MNDDDANTEPTTCPHCDGTGEVTIILPDGSRDAAGCARCQGLGEVGPDGSPMNDTTHSDTELLQAYQAREQARDEEVQELKNTVKRLENIVAMFRTEERNRRVADSRAAESKDNRHLKSVEVSQDSRAYQSKGETLESD